MKTEQNGTILIENRPSEDELDTILKTLTTEQLRYVVARQQVSTDKEAAQMIGIRRPQTVSEWGEPVKRAVELMALDGVHVAREILRRSLPKAMAVKSAGLESNNERVRQDVATEIIDREMGKPVARTETKLEGSLLLKFDLPK